MGTCARCHKRKAKRRCPALGLDLCPLCCGLIREKKIHCPSSCPFLAQHKPYQEKKILQKKGAYTEEVFKDERLRWLALHIEAPLAERAKKDSSFTDKEALFALEYVREKIEKEKGRLLVPGEKSSLQNETGEAIFESIEGCRYQRKIILPHEVTNYKEDEKLKCLDTIIQEVKYLAADDWGGRNYLQELIDQFYRLAELADKKKVILSS